MRIHFLIFSLVLVYFATANPGDEIFETKCSKMGDRDFCVSLKEAEDCGLEIELEVDKMPVLHQKLKNMVESELCVPFSNFYGKIDLCVSLLPKPSDDSQLCVNAFVKGISSVVIDCFPKERLHSVKNCEHYIPPTTVNNHVFERCTTFENLPLAEICGRVLFHPVNCSMEIAVGIEGDYEKVAAFPITVMKGRLQDEENCIFVGDFSACLNWNDLKLTETSASGCAEFVFSGPNIPTTKESLGCFQDNQLIPNCWTGCKNQCNGRGICNSGVCHCVGRWSGDDCSVAPANLCNNDCNSHGACVNGVCHCAGGYTGDDCSVRPMESSSDKIIHDGGNTTEGHWRGVLVGLGIVVILVVLASAGFVGWHFYQKRRFSQPNFNRLDLVDDDDDWDGTQLNE